MPRGTWGALPYGSFSGPYNTVEGDVGAYNTVCVRVAAEYYSTQGMVPSTVILTCEPCLAFLHTSSSSHRAGIPSRMALVGSECAGQRRAVSRVPMSPGWRDTGSESEVSLWARPFDQRGLPIGEGVQRRLEAEVSAPIGVVGRRGR